MEVHMAHSQSAHVADASTSRWTAAVGRGRRRIDELAAWWRGTAVLGVLLVLTTVVFAALALAAHETAYFPVDLALSRAVQTGRTPALDALAEAVSWPGFPPQSNVIFGALILLLARCRRFAATFGTLLAAGGSALLWYAIAPVVARPRPSPDLIYVSQQIGAGSFPSGHVLNLTAGVGFAWFLAYTLLPRTWWRTALLSLLPIFLVFLGLARVYSGQHWPSDVLGGYLLGGMWLWLSITGYRWAQRIRAPRDSNRPSEFALTLVGARRLGITLPDWRGSVDGDELRTRPMGGQRSGCASDADSTSPPTRR
jgi:membrane-associated phospholipid phosphatase